MIKKIYIAFAGLLCCVSVLSQTNKPYTHETNDYKIEFPSEPKKITQTIPSVLGELLLIIASYEPNQLAKDTNYVYQIIESKYPDSTIHSDKTEMLANFFRESIDGAVKNVNGKLLKETSGKVDKYPSRIIEIDYGNGLAIIKMQMILKESKMIIIQTITETKMYPNLSSTNFFESFKLQ